MALAQAVSINSIGATRKRLITLVITAVALAACSVPTGPAPEVMKAKRSLKVASDGATTSGRIARN